MDSLLGTSASGERGQRVGAYGVVARGEGRGFRWGCRMMRSLCHQFKDVDGEINLGVARGIP